MKIPEYSLGQEAELGFQIMDHFCCFRVGGLIQVLNVFNKELSMEFKSNNKIKALFEREKMKRKYSSLRSGNGS